MPAGRNRQEESSDSACEVDWHEGPAPYATDASDVGDELAPAIERRCAQRLIHRPGKLAGVWYLTTPAPYATDASDVENELAPAPKD